MKGIRWGAVVFFAVIHVWGFIGIAYVFFGPSATMWLGIAAFFIHMFSITGWNHRRYSHKAFECNKVVDFIMNGFSAGSGQKAILDWAPKHRLHHRWTDTPLDPYDATRGFWWPHLGWILYDRSKPDPNDRSLADLFSDPMLIFQRRWYYPLMLSFGLLLPTVIASFWGDPIGGILITGTRLMFQGHATGLVNSFCHMFGRQNFLPKESARDAWASISSMKAILISVTGIFVAILTCGEGWRHAFHHRYSKDWRCGWKWYDPDPTKWLIWTLSIFGLAWNLDVNTTPEEKIRGAQACA